MKKIYRWIVNHPKTVAAFYAVLLILSLVAKPLVEVNYDINSYLPEDSASTVALEVLEQEYTGGIPNTRVMIKNVTVPEALEYKEKLQAVEGVTDVTWLDDSVDITYPLEVLDSDTVETYYKDSTALYSVTIAEDSRISACNTIREIIGEDNCLAGAAVATAAATESTVKEIPLIAAFGIAFAFVVLLLTTASWAEPLIVLLGLGVAVLINSGSNIIFGEISFVTNASGSILQLAVSLDYSVFLLHRFEECRKSFTDPKEAMVEALSCSATSILSSGLTTVIGFLALCLMRFRIGPDLGLALAKGVAISLITVFTFMPVFILLTYRLVDKTRHRSFMPSFRGFGKFIMKVMIPMTCVFAVLVVPSYLASNANSFYYGASHIFSEGTTLGDDTAEIEEVFGKSGTYVLMVPKSSTAVQKELSDELHGIDKVKSIISYVDTVGETIPEYYLDSATLSKLNSENYTRMVLTVDAAAEGDAAFELVEEIRATAEKYYPGTWLLAGEAVSTLDLRDTITADMTKVNLIAIAAVFVVLMLTMKAAVLPVLLVLGIETAIWINLSFPYFTDQPIFYLAYLIISSIQLGATVDYAILFTDRYMEYRRSMNRKEAALEVISTCTVSVMTSASVLCVVGFLMGLISTHGLIAQLGTFLGRGTLCSIAVVLFALPGMLYLLDGVIRRTTIGAKFLTEVKKDE